MGPLSPSPRLPPFPRTAGSEVWEPLRRDRPRPWHSAPVSMQGGESHLTIKENIEKDQQRRLCCRETGASLTSGFPGGKFSKNESHLLSPFPYTRIQCQSCVYNTNKINFIDCKTLENVFTPQIINKEFDLNTLLKMNATLLVALRSGNSNLSCLIQPLGQGWQSCCSK